MFQLVCPVVQFLESNLPVLLTYNNEITIDNLFLLKSIADYCEWTSCEWQMPSWRLVPKTSSNWRRETEPYPSVSSFKHIHYLAMYHTPCANFLEIQVGKYTLQGTNISPKKWHFEDDFPFPQVGYVNPLEGIQVSYMFLYHTCSYIKMPHPAAPQSSPQVRKTKLLAVGGQTQVF